MQKTGGKILTEEGVYRERNRKSRGKSQYALHDGWQNDRKAGEGILSPFLFTVEKVETVACFSYVKK